MLRKCCRTTILAMLLIISVVSLTACASKAELADTSHLNSEIIQNDEADVEAKNADYAGIDTQKNVDYGENGLTEEQASEQAIDEQPIDDTTTQGGNYYKTIRVSSLYSCYLINGMGTYITDKGDKWPCLTLTFDRLTGEVTKAEYKTYTGYLPTNPEYEQSIRDAFSSGEFIYAHFSNLQFSNDEENEETMITFTIDNPNDFPEYDQYVTTYIVNQNIDGYKEAIRQDVGEGVIIEEGSDYFYDSFFERRIEWEN